MTWFVRVGEENFKAPNVQTLAQWLAEGRVNPDSLVYHPERKEWLKLRDLPEIKAPPSSSPPSKPRRSAISGGCGVGCLVLLIVGALLVVVFYLGGRASPPRPSEDTKAIRQDSTWIKPGGNFYTGVRLFVGDEDGHKELVGTVLGGNDKYVDPRTGERYRAVKIEFESGRVEWRRREDIGYGPTWWVRSDDPAIERGWWKVYER